VHIYKDALALIEEIQGIRPTFEFLYGGVVSSDDKFGEKLALMIKYFNFKRYEVKGPIKFLCHVIKTFLFNGLVGAGKYICVGVYLHLKTNYVIGWFKIRRQQ
jgi:hypothetical protein